MKAAKRQRLGISLNMDADYSRVLTKVKGLIDSPERSAALNPLLTTNSEQFTANLSRDPGATYIKAMNLNH
jgi:hypothetical protein